MGGGASGLYGDSHGGTRLEHLYLYLCIYYIAFTCEGSQEVNGKTNRYQETYLRNKVCIFSTSTHLKAN